MSSIIGEVPDGYRSGFVTLVGRPNVGKSTLFNRFLGQKVTIVSDKPQTTRNEIRGVLTRPGVQAVFCDTPGIHKPRTLLGERLNRTARATLGDMDVDTNVVLAGEFGCGCKCLVRAGERSMDAHIAFVCAVAEESIVLGQAGGRSLWAVAVGDAVGTRDAHADFLARIGYDAQRTFDGVG